MTIMALQPHFEPHIEYKVENLYTDRIGVSLSLPPCLSHSCINQYVTITQITLPNHCIVMLMMAEILTTRRKINQTENI